MPRVSVLMPVYNAERYVAESIDSVLSQTYTDWELIIGDDGSTDKTEEIIKSYKNERIKYYKNTENKGHTYTKYTLLEKSTGEYIAFLDADDVSLPERLTYQVDFLDKNPTYGLCGTWGVMIDTQGHFIKRMKYITKNEDIRCVLMFNTAFLQSSIMVRRDLMRNLYYDPEILLVEDYNFECLVAKECKTENLPVELVEYRWHASNISNTKQEILNNLNKKIYKRELLNIGINATDYELDIHNAIRDKDSFAISNNEFFKAANVWLKKLAGANQLCRTYDHPTFLATICFRWIYTCKERKAYFKVFKLPVHINFSILKKLVRMLFIKLS